MPVSTRRSRTESGGMPLLLEPSPETSSTRRSLTKPLRAEVVGVDRARTVDGEDELQVDRYARGIGRARLLGASRGRGRQQKAEDDQSPQQSAHAHHEFDLAVSATTSPVAGTNHSTVTS